MDMNVIEKVVQDVNGYQGFEHMFICVGYLNTPFTHGNARITIYPNNSIGIWEK